MRLLGLFSVLFLWACQPQDNSLKTQDANPQGRGHVNSNNLRVGAYGLPIFAAQNLEQVGVLISDCLHSDSGEVMGIGSDSRLQKRSCVIRVHDQDNKGISTAREKWQIHVIFSSADNRLMSAHGEILSSQDYGQFKGALVELQYFYKEFFMELNPDSGEMEVEIQAYGETKSDKSSLKFDFNLEAQGRETAQTQTQWNFKNLKFDLKVRDSQSQIKNFHTNSKALQLNWKTPRCAEISGEAETMDRANRNNKKSIRLSPGKAELIVTQGSPWSQSYFSCDARQTPIRNFEFLFY